MKLGYLLKTNRPFRWHSLPLPVLLPCLFIVIFSSIAPAFTQENEPTILLSDVVFSGKVIAVLSGDTLELKSEGEIRKVRVANIDAPESGQAYSEAAKKFLSKTLLGKTVTVHAGLYDWSGEKISCGHVDLDETDVGTKMIESGLAWYCEKPLSDSVLKKLEAEARSGKKGLWHDPDPMPPWKFRGAKECFEEGKM